MRPIDKPQGRLGALWMVYGVICLAEAVWIAVKRRGLDHDVGYGCFACSEPLCMDGLLSHFSGGNGRAGRTVQGYLSLLAGMALMRRASSSRPLALAASFLGILNGPLGIALGVYTLVLLVSRASWRVHDRLPNAA